MNGRRARVLVVVLACLAALIPPVGAQPPPSRIADADDVEWAIPRPPLGTGRPVVAEQRRQVLVTNGDQIERWTFDGVQLPTWGVGSDRIGAVMVDGDEVLVVAGESGAISLARFSLGTGQRIARYSLNQWIEFPTRLGDRIWFSHVGQTTGTRFLGYVEVSTGVAHWEVHDQLMDPDDAVTVGFTAMEGLLATPGGRLLGYYSTRAWVWDPDSGTTDVSARISRPSGYAHTPQRDTIWFDSTEYDRETLTATGRTSAAVGEFMAGEVVGHGDAIHRVGTGDLVKRFRIDGAHQRIVALSSEAALVEISGFGRWLAWMTFGPTVRDTSPDFWDSRLSREITVYGSGFTDATRVLFGGVVASSFVVVSDHELVATVPAGLAAGSVPVSVHGSLGSSGSHPFWVGVSPGMTAFFISADVEGVPEEAHDYDLGCEQFGVPGTPVTQERLTMEPGFLTARAVPPGTECRLRWTTTGTPNPNFGFVTPRGQFFSHSGDRLTFEVGLEEVHARVVARPAAAGNPIRISTGVVGGGSRSQLYRFRVRCNEGNGAFDTIVEIRGAGYHEHLGRGRCDITPLVEGMRWVRGEQSGEGAVTVEPSARVGTEWPAVTFFDITEPRLYQYPVVIGSPGEDIGAKEDAGIVTVLATNGDGVPVARRSRNISQGTPGVPGRSQAGDEWGSTVVVADFNRDGWDDIVVGAPGEDIAGAANAGAITLLRGDGLSPLGRGATLIHRASAGIPGPARAHDRFGSALAVVDWNMDAFPDLAIGVPGDDQDGVRNAGSVLVLMGSPQGLTSDGAVVLTQNSPGIPNTSERGDRWGSVLAADGRTLVIGAPKEDLAGHKDAGSVTLVMSYRAEGALINQRTAGGKVEAGDLFGSALDFSQDILAIGAPGETLRRRQDAGAVSVVRVDSQWDRPHKHWRASVDYSTRNEGGWVGPAEAGDRFGASVLVLGPREVLVGVPGATVDGTEDAGMVLLDRDRFLHADNPGVPGKVEPGDAFGSALAVGRLTSVLMIGAPNEEVRGRAQAGAVVILGLGDSYSKQITASTPGVKGKPEPGDRFGSSLAAS